MFFKQKDGLKQYVKIVMKKNNNNFKRTQKGTCLRYINGNQVLRSKYQTEEDALNALNLHKRLGVVNVNYSVYKCPKCKTFHFGNIKIELNE